MLPFLKHKRTAGLIVTTRSPDGDKKELYQEGDEHAGLEACAEDIINAISNKDAKALASALKAAFEVCDAQPHEEGPHTYEAQNELAAKENR